MSERIMQSFVSAEDIHENSKWYELTPGAEIYEPGTSRQVMTGEWRVLTPVFDAAKRQIKKHHPACRKQIFPCAAGQKPSLD